MRTGLAEMKGVESLSYAVRLRVIAAYLGQLLFLLGGFSVGPLIFAAASGEWAHAGAYAGAVLALIGTGWLMQLRKPAADIQVNEALVVVAASFVVASLVMALPMMTKGVDFLDALFEAVSGLTTTGLSTFADVEDKPMSLLFEAAWLQWLGGIAIMVLSFALLAGQSASIKRLTAVVGQPEGIGAVPTPMRASSSVSMSA